MAVRLKVGLPKLRENCPYSGAGGSTITLNRGVIGNNAAHFGYGWCEPPNRRRCQNGAHGQRVSAA
jgi:hypothetical protein